MSRLAFAVFSPEGEIRSLVTKELEDTGWVDVIGEFWSIDDLEHAVRIHRLDGLYADVGSNADAVLSALEGLPETRPALVLGGSVQDTQVLLRAMRLGVREFFVDHQISDQLLVLLERIRSQATTGARVGDASSVVIAVIGSKGGVGTTLVACELAASLQRLGERAAIVDLNLHLGDVAMHFDLTPDFNLSDMAKKGEGLDGTFVRTIAATHASGVSVVSAPAHLDDVGLVTPSDIEHVLSLMRDEFDRVVLDISRPWDDLSMRAISISDQILIVTTVDVPALSHTKQHLELLERLGVSSEQIRLVVNRHDSSGTLGRREIRDFLGRAPDAMIPNDETAAMRSVNHGKLIQEVQKGGKVDQAFNSLAEASYAWSNLEVPEKKRGRALGNRLRKLILRR